MTNKIFRSSVLLSVLVLLCSMGIVMGVLYRHFTVVQVAQLKDELSLAATATEQYGNTFLENVEPDRFRITWIASDGEVLFDTLSDAQTMENHADRVEFIQALQTGYGNSVRYSSTRTERTFYEAKRLQDGTVLRISSTSASVGALLLGMLQPIVVIIVIAIALSAFLAGKMAKTIVEPLNDLDLEHPLQNKAYPEISPLLQRINNQHLQITAQMRMLKHRADEFEQVTANMQEGLVLLSGDCTVLSINPTASAIFCAESDSVGQSFFCLRHSNKIRTAVNDAFDRGHGRVHIQESSRDYQIDLSRIESDGSTVGAVLLAFDVTQSLRAEQARQEFSANVSHELKTPLQSIMGSAELMESGLVKPEDTLAFVGNIRKEAARLLNLIEDIIRLSQLDEGQAPPMEDVELLSVCHEVAAVLADAKSDVSVRVHGEPVHMHGIRRLLYEIVYNLCDNAIRYNIPNGSVSIHVSQEQDLCILTVADTGIGIPAEHLDRIFERFYRVDKSHSRRSGGTGLGLSIVKHAVQHHNAKVEIQSAPGEGTTVTVIFQSYAAG